MYIANEETLPSTDIQQYLIVNSSQVHHDYTHGCNRPLRLIFMIMSSPFGAPKRAAIRRSWLALYEKRVREVKFTGKFVIGTKGIADSRLTELSNEQLLFNDIVHFDDFQDSFHNLTVKVLRSIVWAKKHYQFDYLIKCDDDTFIQIDRLVRALRQMNCPRYLYWGYFTGKGRPDLIGKWAERQWYLCPHYIPYAMGGGYVLSRQLVNVIANLSHVLQIYNNEDVTVGLWMAPYNITRIHDIRFNCEGHSHGCNNNYIMSHKEKASSLIQKRSNFVQFGKICGEMERELRPAYIYNWSAPPYLCCQREYGITIPE